MENNKFKYLTILLVIIAFVILFSGVVTAATTQSKTTINKDLVVTSLKTTSSATPGNKITVSYTIKNNGKSKINKGFYAYFYLTPTKSLSGTKTYLSRQYFSSISAYKSISKKPVFKVPKIAYGSYYVGVKIDATNAIKEKNEKNNIRYTTSKTKIYKPVTYIGNRNSGIFHEATCGHVKLMKSYNKIGFSTKSAAIKAGYRLCKICAK